MTEQGMKREDLNFFMQQVPAGELAELRQRIEERAAVRCVQQPTAQTLLVPVRDPVTGGAFLAGEVLVPSAIVTVDGSNGSLTAHLPPACWSRTSSTSLKSAGGLLPLPKGRPTGRSRPPGWRLTCSDHGIFYPVLVGEHTT